MFSSLASGTATAANRGDGGETMGIRRRVAKSITPMLKPAIDTVGIHPMGRLHLVNSVAR